MLTVNEIVIKVVGYKMQGREDWHELVLFTLRKDHPELHEEYQQWIQTQQRAFKNEFLTGFARHRRVASASGGISMALPSSDVFTFKKQAKIIEILKKHCTLQNVEL